MGPAEVKALVADLSALKDGNGNSFLSGLSKIDDDIVIHDGYYRGSWQSDGSFKRDSYFDKKAANFENEVTLNETLIDQILQKHGLTFVGVETKLVRAETNPYIKSGKDTIKSRKANLSRPASGGRKDKSKAERERDIQAVSLLRGHFFDASRSAEPSQKAVKYDADQIAEIRKTITRSSPPLPKRKKPQQVAAGLGWGVKKAPPLPAGLPKLSKAQNDSFRQLGSDAGVLSAVANSDLVPSSIDPGMAAKVFDSVMAIAEVQPAKLLENYDKEFIDLQTPFLSKMLKEGVKDLTADSIKFKQKYQRTIREIDSQLKLKRSNKPKLKTQQKSAIGTLAKREAANDNLIKKAEADGIITRNQAQSLHRRIGSRQDLMPDVAPVPRRYLGEGGEQHPFFSQAFDTSQPSQGGRYFDMGSKADITGQTFAGGTVSTVGGKRRMNISDEVAESIVAKRPGDEGRLTRVNLFDSKKTGWKWSKNKPANAPDTVVSVEQGDKHYYALTTESAQPVDLATYPNKKSEPRLRPTTRGKIKLGKKVGEFIYQGKKRPVYDTVKIVKPAPRQSLMPSDAFYPSETKGALRVLTNELGYRVTHTADGKYRLYDKTGVLMGVAASKASLSALYERRVIVKS
jgi:hypothetical protein